MQETVSFYSSDAKGLDCGNRVYELLSANLDKLSELLMAYHFSSRERVSGITIDKSSLYIDGQGRGSFIVHYTIGLFNACADLDYTDDAKMTVEFAVNPESGEVALTGEYIPEREPDEF
ncbi:hypothetical protein FW774_11725 [Pedobacter sp. BS3]|uniref:hypothetical protein n=1 Tax=Pedobacter sp. BS3 TaxID=2567937 RepID=UPI0011EFE192|nr:hypothetical protein [Pedobacter sp. BS3]TZF84102.1 hypothetical protein FW774_11725 [Pedobacter sp. BS3]